MKIDGEIGNVDGEKRRENAHHLFHLKCKRDFIANFKWSGKYTYTSNVIKLVWFQFFKTKQQKIITACTRMHKLTHTPHYIRKCVRAMWVFRIVVMLLHWNFAYSAAWKRYTKKNDDAYKLFLTRTRMSKRRWEHECKEANIKQWCFKISAVSRCCHSKFEIASDKNEYTLIKLRTHTHNKRIANNISCR